MDKDSNGYLVPRKTYVITSEHGDSCNLIAVFPTAHVRDEFPELMQVIEARNNAPMTYAQFIDTADELAAMLTPWRAFSRGPGRAFGTHPFLILGKRNIVIKQFRSLDI